MRICKAHQNGIPQSTFCLSLITCLVYYGVDLTQLTCGWLAPSHRTSYSHVACLSESWVHKPLRCINIFWKRRSVGDRNTAILIGEEKEVLSRLFSIHGLIAEVRQWNCLMKMKASWIRRLFLDPIFKNSVRLSSLLHQKAVRNPVSLPKPVGFLQKTLRISDSLRQHPKVK